MIKLTVAIVVLLVAGGIWIRSQWARSKNSGAARQIIDNLKSGKYVIESYQESLGILICTKHIHALPEITVIKERLQSLSGKKITDKFSIDYADTSEAGNSLVIGEAKGIEMIGDRKMEIHFPCWLYIELSASDNKILFKSTFPESKDHHHLLEDLAELLFDKYL